jgi:transcriptional regulator with XRE-family HTH domain
MIITSISAKYARLELGISQNKVAKDTGLSRPYLSNFELGKYNPNDDFKETLKAYYLKEGIVFKDKADNPELTTPEPTTPKPDTNTKLVRDVLANELLKLQNKPLPIKDGLFYGENIDEELLKKTIDTAIYDMAKAYLKILTIQKNNPLSIKPNDLPMIDDLTSDDADKYSIGDYITNTLFDDDKSANDESDWDIF